MKLAIVPSVATILSISVASVVPHAERSVPYGCANTRDPSNNTPTSRACWGQFSINDNFYEVGPDTGVVREYYLDVVNTTLAPDGYLREVLAFNGTIPGPTITADWGDTLLIHVTNRLAYNGTSVHWHGIRQRGSPEADGVPGVTQCPIAPGETMTYKYRLTQYGTTWYHSHFTLQYSDGLQGPLIINGPATANYDEDLGVLLLTDWAHTDIFTLWEAKGKFGPPPTLENGLINGKNTFDCSGSGDPNCLGNGTRFETKFVPGKKYRIRVVNSATDGFIRFAIDNHKFQVIANDLVPITPYETDSVILGIGQRYDIVVVANAPIGNYWLRAIWQTACGANGNANGILGIVRYQGANTSGDPTTVSGNFPNRCGDEPSASLQPHVKLNVGKPASEEPLILSGLFGTTFRWAINSSSLLLQWDNPTFLRIINHENTFPTSYNVENVTGVNDWVYWIIEDQSGFGITHPIHLHGHDFFVLAQGTGAFNSTVSLDTRNPPRRDVASLPGNGFLVIAFQADNPGSWLMHCHIAWHASQGLAVQFMERKAEINGVLGSFTPTLQSLCKAWNTYIGTEIYQEDDSGI